MTAFEITLLCLTCLLLIIAVILGIKHITLKDKITRLQKNIEKYFNTGSLTPFSTSESDFSLLQNAVCDLENKVELQKHNTAVQEKKNSDFIADISHQLKTPIAALRLYVEMDNAGNSSPHSEKEIQLLDKMENLIAKLLKLEKLRTDEYAMDFSQNNTDNIFGELINDFKPIYSNKSITVTGSAQLRCDKAWIKEAFGNVIKNACEHTDENGTIKIDIDDSEKSVLITVTDNGGGVESEELPKLFTRFHRTKNATPQSAGIGLAITKTIVEKHHGTISAENCENGLKITICLPKIDGMITI